MNVTSRSNAKSWRNNMKLLLILLAMTFITISCSSASNKEETDNRSAAQKAFDARLQTRSRN